MIIQRTSVLFLMVATLSTFVPIDLDARGFRGGGGGRVSKPSSRPANRPSARPSSRPRTTRPTSRPASGWNLDSGIFQSNPSTNRTPSLTDRSHPSGSKGASQRDAARNRAMANPSLKPMFDGNTTARRSEARDRMNKAVRTSPTNRSQISAARVQTRNTWGNSVRASVNPLRRTTFNNQWMSRRIDRFPQRWFYWHRPRADYWWWRWATWSSFATWIAYDWGDPFYYDYGYNPYYEDDVIFFNEEPVSSYEDYVASAQELASVPDPTDEETDWESLGTWALSTNRDHSDSQMMIQLVLSPEGLVSGTYYHAGTDNTQRIHGSVDHESQRISFIIGDKSTTILETGLANLTKDEAPLWVHFTDAGNTQTWLLARLESPEPAPENPETNSIEKD